MDSYKVELPHFNFSSRITCLKFLLYPWIVLAFTHFHFTSLIFLILITEWFVGIILSDNLMEDFCPIGELDEYLSALLSTFPKTFNNCKILSFYNIYNYVIKTFCFNGLGFKCTILAIILSILLSKILSRLSLYELWTSLL